MKRSLVALVVAVLATACLVEAKARPRPFNRVVVMIDGSGSYAGRQPAAIEKASQLLERMADTKVRRWEASDEVVIVALDAIPEVIWRGDLRRLRAEQSARWTERFKARQDYAACTDVIAGFRLAAQELNRAPVPVARYLAAFTDLVDEPPLAAPTVCKPVTRPGPPDGFPWQALHGVSTAVFWVPIAQKLAWHRGIAAQGGDLQVTIYAESESASVELLPPPKAARVVTETERVGNRDRAVAALQSLGGGALQLVLLAAALLAAMGLVARWRKWYARRGRSLAAGRRG